MKYRYLISHAIDSSPSPWLVIRVTGEDDSRVVIAQLDSLKGARALVLELESHRVWPVESSLVSRWFDDDGEENRDS